MRPDQLRFVNSWCIRLALFSTGEILFTYALLVVCVFVCGWAAPAWANHSQDETRELERAVSDDPRRALSRAEDWLKTAQGSGDKVGELKALRLLTLANDQIENSAKLKINAERGATLARELGNWEALCEFTAAKAAVEVNQGRYGGANAFLDEATALAQKYGLPVSAAKIDLGRANLARELGRISDALALLINAYDVFEAHGEKRWMANTLSAFAGIYSHVGASPAELAKAIEYNKRSLAFADPKVNRFDAATDYHNLGVNYFRLKDYAQAKPYFEKSMALSRDLKDPVSVAYVNYRLGLIARDEKRLAEGLDYFAIALPAFKESGNVTMQLQLLLARAEVLSMQERRKESLDALAAARVIFEPLRSPRREVTYYEKAAQIYARFRDHEQAYKHMLSLRDAEQRVAEAANSKQAAELQTRFDVKVKEAENALLRSKQTELEARRLALILALILCLVVVGGLAFYLVRQARRNQRFQNLAMRDDLTGLPNRRSILEFARLQFRGRRAADKGFCVALIDLDHFKAINDEFGHNVGDAVLVAFSDAWQRQLRVNDRMGRFGGEEFLLVMPGSDAAQIAQVFERLRSAVQKVEVVGLPADRRLTFSMGGAEARTDGETLDGMIKRADEALYRAKQAGRDRFDMGQQNLKTQG